MKIIIVIATFVFLSGFAACSGDSGREPLPVPTAVRLEGAIGLSTRAVIGSGYNEDLKVCFARQDETGAASGAYGGWSVYSAVRIGGGGPRPIVFVETQLYPADGKRIGLHGYYPADGAGAVSDPTAGKVTFTIDGKTDVMATGRLLASAAQPAAACTFHHLLTQLSFVCYSDLAENWGQVTKIEATDIPLLQELDWMAGDPALTAAGGSRTGTLPVSDIPYPLAIQEVNQGDPLPTDATGYILLPVGNDLGTPANQLWLNVTTTKDGRGNDTETTFRVPVSLVDGFLAGNRHVLFLFFNGGIGIEVTRVTVVPWQNQEQPGEIPV